MENMNIEQTFRGQITLTHHLVEVKTWDIASPNTVDGNWRCLKVRSQIIDDIAQKEVKGILFWNLTKLLRNWFSPLFVKAWTLLSWKYQYLDFHLILSSFISINWESSSWPTTILCYCAFKPKVAESQLMCIEALGHRPFEGETLERGKSEKMLLEIYINILVPI